MRAEFGAALLALSFLVGAGTEEGKNAQAPTELPTELDEDAEEEEPKRRYVVAAMGDSLTDPKSHGGKYLTGLKKRCPQSTFDSYGVGGQMVNQMRKRFAKDVLGIPEDEDNPKPDYTHVIILGGINDICSDESANRTNAKIKADLMAMYQAARTHGLEVIAITLPPWGGFKKYYNERRAASTQLINDWIRTQYRKGKVDLMLDSYPLLSCGDPELLCEPYGWPDKVHWSKKGHEVVATALYDTIFSDCE